jgi:hypothetical protein
LQATGLHPSLKIWCRYVPARYAAMRSGSEGGFVASRNGSTLRYLARALKRRQFCRVLWEMNCRKGMLGWRSVLCPGSPLGRCRRQRGCGRRCLRSRQRGSATAAVSTGAGGAVPRSGAMIRVGAVAAAAAASWWGGASRFGSLATASVRSISRKMLLSSCRGWQSAGNFET